MTEFIEQLALEGVITAFDSINTQKTCQLIIDSDNHYLGALKGNQGNLHKSVQSNFVAEASYTDLCKGHGRRKKRVVSLCTTLDNIKPWPGLKTLVRVESERQFKKGGQLRLETETRHCIASFLESAESFTQRIRDYWGVENKVYHVRDVTQGEDASRIRMHQWPQIFAVARNFALNLCHSNEFSSVAQAERFCKFGLVLEG